MLKKLEPEGAGRPPYDPAVMFRALLLAQLYDLSDAALEEALNDRVSFRRFVGLPLEAAMPDRRTIQWISPDRPIRLVINANPNYATFPQGEGWE